ncbi:hypothetical protein NP493_144g02002, partial [Ridgeia piscesae]
VFRVLYAYSSLVLLPNHEFCILAVHLVCLLISGLVGAQTGHSDVITCLEARYKCRHDDTCSSLLEKMTRTCDRSIYTCYTTTPADCYTVLTSLQRDVAFRRCTCDPNDMDATECLELQKRIFRHRCLSDEGGRGATTSVATEWGHSLSPSLFDVDEEDDQEDYTETSCIRIRKECLQEGRCHGILKDFWTERCFRAMEELRPTGIFQCTCRMRKSSALSRCQRIQFRVAKNRCLVEVPYFVHSTKPDLSHRQLIDTLNDTTTRGDRDENTRETSVATHSMRKCHLSYVSRV